MDEIFFFTSFVPLEEPGPAELLGFPTSWWRGDVVLRTTPIQLKLVSETGVIGSIEGTFDYFASARWETRGRDYYVDFALDRRIVSTWPHSFGERLKLPVLAVPSTGISGLSRVKSRMRLTYRKISADPGFISHLSEKASFDALPSSYDLAASLARLEIDTTTLGPLSGPCPATAIAAGVNEFEFENGDYLPVQLIAPTGESSAVVRLDNIDCHGECDATFYFWQQPMPNPAHGALVKRVVGWRELSPINGELYERRCEAVLGVVV